MSLKERVAEDMKAAMKAGNTAKRDALRLISAAFKQAEVDSRKDLTDEDVVKILQKEAKRRQEAIVDLEKAGRDTSAEKAELSLIESYLPQQLDRADLIELAKQAIAQVGATSPKDMGNVMKALLPQIQGRADGKLVSDVVRELLS
jgi:hypothetical protein